MKVWALIADMGNEREVRTFATLGLAQMAMQFHVGDLCAELGTDEACVGSMFAEMTVGGVDWEWEIYETEVEA